MADIILSSYRPCAEILKTDSHEPIMHNYISVVPITDHRLVIINHLIMYDVELSIVNRNCV